MNQFEKAFAAIHEQINQELDWIKFENLTTEYCESIINSFLNEQVSSKCVIKKLNKGHYGYERYDEDFNSYLIVINEDIVKEIYMGINPFNVFTIFHEIAHVYDDFNIKNKNFKDASLKKICIERNLGNLFYKLNYSVISVEAHANLIASKLIQDFYKNCGIIFTDEERKSLLFMQFDALNKLNKNNRNYDFLFDGSEFNDFELPLNEIISEIQVRYPDFYLTLQEKIGEKNLEIDSPQLSEFEKKVYDEFAILELGNIITNPLFTELIDDQTKHRPKI